MSIVLSGEVEDKMSSDRQAEQSLITVEIGCSFGYLAEMETPAVVLVEPHSSLQDRVLEARWEATPPQHYEDLYGNVCQRVTLPPGDSSLAYVARVLVSPDPEEMPGAADAQAPIEDLGSPLLHWLLPSRFCESDLLADRAWELFGETAPNGERVQAVCDWIHDTIEYGVPTIPTTTTSEVLAASGGMCRDMAHLGVTFCRALGIPARYVSGYLPDIGVQGVLPLQDFHAWFEVLLGGRWWTFDARFNVPRTGRVPIGRGRDAADVAMITTYGPAKLQTMAVWANLVTGESEAWRGE